MIRITQKNFQENGKPYLAEKSSSFSHLINRIFVTVLLVALPIIGIAQVMQTNQLARSGWVLNQLVKERNTLEANVRILEASIASNVKLREIHTEATTRLGMIPVERTMHISINQRQAAPIQVPLRFTSKSNGDLLPQKKWWEPLLNFTFSFFSKSQESEQ